MKSTIPNLVGKTLLVVLCTFLYTKSFSQHLMFGGDKLKIEAGLNFGPTFFLGDLGGHAGYGTKFIKDVNLPLTKLMKGAFVSVYPNDWLGIRVAGQYTYVEGRDDIINTKGVNELWRKQRNLDFKSNMWEAYTAVEIYPTMLFKKYDDYDPLIKPYVFLGVGVFHFDPMGSLTDANGNTTWYKLQPLHTEGEGFPQYPDRKPYKLTQVNIPLGGGLKIRLSDRVNTGLELLYRKTFTDYIDDVSTKYIDPNYFYTNLSPADAAIAAKIADKTVGIVTPGVNRYPPGTQRGNSNNMDAYFSFLVKLGVRFGYSSSEERRSARQTRCPHFY
ncbi:MAG: hypothetical protein JSU03_06975 [Bacteroidetes bacterium]|nr:hypothetical protein [Bacteroidota bacterium]MBS1757005.1 hypothetical protein [Bacteroidota bacterium]